MSHHILRNSGIRILSLILSLLIIVSCGKDDPKGDHDIPAEVITKVDIPKRPGPRPQTTMEVPHEQIGVEPVSEVNEELIRRVYSIPGIEDHPSVTGSWQGLRIAEDLTIVQPDAIIDEREFAHIHDDGSLHIFLEPSRSLEAVDSCWAVFHPFAVEQMETGGGIDPGGQEKSWQGFVMLYTPQSIDELNVSFQLIVDGFNYVTGQNLIATDYY